MATYEVKAWITVDATSESEALQKAADILDSLPEQYIANASIEIEGESAVYELEDCSAGEP